MARAGRPRKYNHYCGITMDEFNALAKESRKGGERIEAEDRDAVIFEMYLHNVLHALKKSGKCEILGKKYDLVKIYRPDDMGTGYALLIGQHNNKESFKFADMGTMIKEKQMKIYS